LKCVPAFHFASPLGCSGPASSYGGQCLGVYNNCSCPHRQHTRYTFPLNV
jgi:hypothetical protein